MSKNNSTATIRIFGDELIPAEITKALGSPPSHSQTKGDKIIGKNTGNERTSRYGMWRLDTPDREPEDLDSQITDILGQLTDDLAVWESLGNRYKIDLFCGFFMESSNEGMELSPESLLALGSRGIKIRFDIYAPINKSEETTIK